MTRHPEHIEDSIEHTKSRIEDRLTDLSDQMSPTKLVNSMFRSNGDSPLDTVESLVEKARENPVPTLLIGAGLAGLLLGTRTSRSQRHGGNNGLEHSSKGYGQADDPATRLGENAAALKRRAGAMQDGVAQTAKDLTETTKTTIASAREAAADLVDTASGQASQAAEKASRKASEIREQAAMSKGKLDHEMRQARLRTESAAVWVKENPVPAGLAALAIGAAAASIFTTRRSNGVEQDQNTGSPSAEAASTGLHREASELEPNDADKGAERFVGLRESATSETAPQTGSNGASVSPRKRKPSPARSRRKKVDTVMAHLNEDPAKTSAPGKQTAGRTSKASSGSTASKRN